MQAEERTGWLDAEGGSFRKDTEGIEPSGG